jgi:uncharacterized membrane protein
MLISILIVLPTGFQKQEYRATEGVRAKIISVNNSGIHTSGIYKLGDQSAIIEIETGSCKGERVKANNMLTGSMSVDKIFQEGDKAWVLIGFDEDNNINFANMIDHYITIMMVYMAQGTPLMNILNSKTISAEILHTFVGCIGLVLVSPLTSMIGGFDLCMKRIQN